jgi:hypothetical protein
MKKNTLCLFFICFIFLWVERLQAQTLHAIICADDGTKDNRIRDRAEDLKNLKSLMSNIALQTGMRLNQKVYTGNTFALSYVVDGLQRLSIGAEDAVIFYFNGHGANEQRNKWPSMGIGNDLYQLTQVHNYLCKTEAKFIMSVGDCCNSYLQRNDFSTNDIDSYITNGDVSKNYKTLFRDFSGRRAIMMSASSQGQESQSHPIYGALFGIAFRKALYRAVQNSNTPSWNNILSNAKNITEQWANNSFTPDYEIKNFGGGSQGSGSGSSGGSYDTRASIYVFDELGQNQGAERMQVTICGTKRNFSLDANNGRSQYHTFSFNNSGTCDYTLSSQTMFYGVDKWGRTYTYWVPGYGSGKVYIAPNKQYVILGQTASNGRSLVLTLQERK